MPEVTSDRYVVNCGWDAVPHLDEATKEQLLGAFPPHEREARTQGIPGLGSGAIYPITLDEITCHPFEIPTYWPKAFGMDVGWNRTAVVWGALDRSVDCLYIYTEHYRGQAEPSIHADAIRARGVWIPGVIDPASQGRSQADGTQLIETYRHLGLQIAPAINAVEAGILSVWQRLSAGRLKIFASCQNLLAEYKFYRRDTSGKVVKSKDHAMDALRYLVTSGVAMAITEPVEAEPFQTHKGDPKVGY